MSKGKKFLKREDFVGVKASKRRFLEEPVPFDEDERWIRLRSLSAGEHGEFEVGTLTKKGGLVRERLVEAKRKLVSITACDEEGNLYLTVADVAAMETTDGRLIAFAYTQACEHCGITEAEIEDCVKNSVAIGGDSSASDSLKNSA